MATIKFILKLSKPGSPIRLSKPAYPIYVRLIDGRNTDVMTKTNFVINPSDWDAANYRVLKKRLSDDYFKVLNSKLETLKSDLLKHYNDSKGQTINTAWLKEFITPSGSTDGHPTGLLNCIDKYIDSKKKSVAPGTLGKFYTIKHKLERYEMHLKSKIEIKDINKKFQSAFESYCIQHKYSHNTIAREVVFIKTICKHALDNGVTVHHQLNGLKVEYLKIENIYLTEKEIEAIKNADSTGFLNDVRDWLIISCFTGQRVSDFMRFTKSMIRYENDNDGHAVPLIEFEQKKTGKIMTLPLHKEIISIIEQRGDFPPAIGIQKYNEHVKTVCQKAGLVELVKGNKKTETESESGVFRKESGIFPKYELISSHIGRRSFATNFYGKIPTSLLIAATGHSTEAMFLNYIGKSSSDRAKELAQYFK